MFIVSNKKYKELKEDYDRVVANYKIYRNAHDELAKDKIRLQNQINSLIKKHEQDRRRSKTLINRNSKARARNNRLIAEQLDKLKNNIIVKDSTISKVQEENRNLHMEISILRNENTGYIKTIEEADIKIKNLIAELSDKPKGHKKNASKE